MSRPACWLSYISRAWILLSSAQSPLASTELCYLHSQPPASLILLLAALAGRCTVGPKSLLTHISITCTSICTCTKLNQTAVGLHWKTKLFFCYFYKILFNMDCVKLHLHLYKWWQRLIWRWSRSCKWWWWKCSNVGGSRRQAWGFDALGADSCNLPPAPYSSPKQEKDEYSYHQGNDHDDQAGDVDDDCASLQWQWWGSRMLLIPKRNQYIQDCWTSLKSNVFWWFHAEHKIKWSLILRWWWL